MTIVFVFLAWILLGGCFGVGFGLGLAGVFYLFTSAHVTPVRKEKKHGKDN